MITDSLGNYRSYKTTAKSLKKYKGSNTLPESLHSSTVPYSVLNTSKYSLASYCDIFSQNFNSSISERSFYSFHVCNSVPSSRFLHTSSILLAEKPSSKVEETVHALKEKAKSQEDAESKPKDVVVKKSLKQKVWDEIIHYYHGFRLLFIDISVSSKLVGRILAGKQLSRRERNLVSEMFSFLN